MLSVAEAAAYLQLPLNDLIHELYRRDPKLLDQFMARKGKSPQGPEPSIFIRGSVRQPSQPLGHEEYPEIATPAGGGWRVMPKKTHYLERIPKTRKLRRKNPSLGRRNLRRNRRSSLAHKEFQKPAN